jgi:hypothetical protein
MKEIALGGTHKGLVAFVDDADYEMLIAHRWHGKQVRKLIYAKTSVPDERKPGKRRSMMMHRMILKQRPELGTDHLDGNGLNNQRHNIIPATHVQNMQNTRLRRARRAERERQQAELIASIGPRLNGAPITPEDRNAANHLASGE